MINANELRICNRIRIGRNEIIVSAETIYNVSHSPKQYFPIPLTEDWLIRFNIFKADGYPHKLLVGYLKLRNGFYFFKYYELEIELQFVHQLQNLYQCLTGQELEVST